MQTQLLLIQPSLNGTETITSTEHGLETGDAIATMLKRLQLTQPSLVQQLR